MIPYCEICKARPSMIGRVFRSSSGLVDIVYCWQDSSAYDAETGQRILIHGTPAFYDKDYVSPSGQHGRFIKSRNEMTSSPLSRK